MIVVTEISEKETRAGCVSKSLAMWLSKIIMKMVAAAKAGKVVRYFEIIWGVSSFIHVYAKGNVRERFIEIEAPSYDIACTNFYLKAPEEETAMGEEAFQRTCMSFWEMKWWWGA